MSFQDHPELERAYTRSEHPYLMWDGIEQIPNAIRRSQEADLKLAVEQARQQLAASQVLHMLGCGTSHFSAIAAVIMYHSLTSRLAIAYEADEFIGHPPPIEAEDGVIAISHSGSTPPVVAAAEWALEHTIHLVAITDEPGSRLAEVAPTVLADGLGTEAPLPKTRSYVTTLLRHLLLVDALAGQEGRQAIFDSDAQEELAQQAQQVIEEQQPLAARLAAEYADVRRVVVVGGGPEMATALEGSLKLTEAALVPSQAWQVEEAGHGIWASTEADDLLIALVSGQREGDKMLKVAQAMGEIGTPVWLIGDRRIESLPASHRSLLPTASSSLVQPMLTIVPIYLFAYSLALERDINPDIMRQDDERYFRARSTMRFS